MTVRRLFRKVDRAGLIATAAFAIVYPPVAASADLASEATVAPSDSAEPSSPATRSQPPEALQEVVVTAQKREERLQDVPIPISVMTGDSLTNTNQVRITDYFNQVPGLIATADYQKTNIILRGLSPAGGGPTVAVTIDDIPLGTNTQATAVATPIPDLDPSELARVEVLRGPQGTLYGASGLGGLVKYVTIDPSMTAFSGRVEAGTNTVHNAPGPGYNVRGSVNLPLSDTLAVRASAFAREDPGYINNPGNCDGAACAPVRGLNEGHVSGGRVAALWQPSADFSVKLTALLQHHTQNGTDDVDLNVNGGPALGALQQSYIPGAGRMDQTLQTYSATVKAKWNDIELTSLTAYNASDDHTSFDYTYAFGGPYVHDSGLYGDIHGTLVPDNNDSRQFVQELRLRASMGEHFEGLLGLFYTHQRTDPNTQSIWAENEATGTIVGNLINFTEPEVDTEAALFTDLTYHFTDRFQMQLGGRAAHIRESLAEVDTGPFAQVFDNGGIPTLVNPAPFIFPVERVSDTAFTYLFTPEFHITPRLMTYLRVASGYRPAGLNESVSIYPGVPTSFKSDTTRNYEIGLKGEPVGEAFTVDASVYDIEWKNTQIQYLVNGFMFEGNAGSARSKGVELSLVARPAAGLRITPWISWNEAELLTNPAESDIYGFRGDPLAYVPRVSGSLSLEQSFTLTQHLTASVGGGVNYQGHRLGNFQNKPSPGAMPPVRDYYSPYAQTNLHAGVQYNYWQGNFYANNVTDRRAIISGGNSFIPPYAFRYIQPRTIGLSFSRSF